MLKGNQKYAKLPLSWKKSFDSGFVIRKKRDNVQGVKKILFVVDVMKILNQIKQFAQNPNEKKTSCKFSWSYTSMVC